MKLIHRITPIALLLAAGLAAWGCSKTPDGIPPTASSDAEFYQQTAAGPAPGRDLRDGAASEGLIGGLVGGLVGALLQIKLIDGLLGGVLNLGNWNVTVPKGAYTGSATITMASADTLGMSAVCNLTITPESKNNFKVPVVVKYQLRTESEVRDNEVLWWDPSARVWRVVTSAKDYKNKTVSAQLYHFSTYGIGKLKGKAGW